MTEDRAGSNHLETLRTELDLVRGFATRALARARTLTDDEVLDLFDPGHSISALGSMHLVLTAGTEFYLLDDQRAERIVLCSEPVLGEITRRLIDRIYGAINSGEIYCSTIAPRLFHMAEKQDPVRFNAAVSPIFGQDDTLISLIQSFQGYSSPYPSLLKYSGLSPVELKFRIRNAVRAKQISLEAWEPWHWFSDIIETEMDGSSSGEA
jgi:hypothetical protein